MKGFKMYHQINQLKELGFTKARTAKQLNINRETVTRYWDMNADEYTVQLYNISRGLLLSKYEEAIISWMKQYPTITAAQVCDWIKEHYKEDFKERTVSRYVKELREKYNLRKSNHPRDYEAVEELPMGQQLQVDFGEKWMKSIDGRRVKVHFAAFVLAHSRYKWAFFQTRPFTTSALVRSCHECFRYLGGMPTELVFDQDSIVSVSENYGDIIHTFEFEKFRQECKLKIYLCRSSDPESKGKIESVVKFIKYNFLENRMFADEEILNYSSLDWLDRTGNGKVHGTIKRIPSKVFEEEREHLRPLLDMESTLCASILRNVRKDNTIVYDSNRYSVPLGTYNSQKEIRIEAKEGRLMVMTVFSDFICEHPISMGRGQLIKNTNHSRDDADSVDNAQHAIDERLLFRATDFLKTIRIEKSRYARDQFRLLKSLLDKYDLDDVLNAIDYCQISRLTGATHVKDFLEYNAKSKQEVIPSPIPISDKKYHITTEKRSLSVYAKVGENS